MKRSIGSIRSHEAVYTARKIAEMIKNGRPDNWTEKAPLPSFRFHETRGNKYINIYAGNLNAEVSCEKVRRAATRVHGDSGAH